jgi:hypothetical protein
MAWIVERTDGRRFVLTAAALDTEDEIDAALLPTMVAGVGLIADE